jgi:SAM-dependent methyltransferase
MKKGKDIWAERLRDRDYATQEPDPFIRDWIKRLSVKGARALDIGCGWGRHLKALCAAGFEAVGLDKSQGMLAAAKSSLDAAGFSAELIQAEATHIPFPAESFHLILATRTIHHGDRRFMVQCLQEVARVLAAGGHLLASFPSVNDWRFGRGIAVEPGTFVPDLHQEEGGIPHHFSNADELLLWLKNYEIVGWEEVLVPYEPNVKGSREYELVESPRRVDYPADIPDDREGRKHWATYFVAAKKKSADHPSL